MNDAERKRFERTERMRPEPTYNSWILLIVTVSVVIFIGLITWYSRYPNRLSLNEPSDHEQIHQLSTEWAARYPQIPGPPNVYLQQAQNALIAREYPDAIEKLTKALSLDPNDASALLRLAIASTLTDAEGALNGEQVAAVISIVEALAPEHPLLIPAKAFQALAAEQPAEALAMLPPEPKTLHGSLARFSAVRALRQDPLVAAEAVLAFAPAAAAPCEEAARRQILSSLPADALRIIDGCQQSGAQSRLLNRLRGDALDQIGHFSHAVDSYREAGVNTHAAAIIYQEGMDGDAAAAFEGDTPDAALHKVWSGLLNGDGEQLASGLAGVEAADIHGLAFDAAIAASALTRGQHQRALESLEKITEPEAQALRARALLGLGKPEDAQQAVRDAMEAVPWNHRLTLLMNRLLREVDPDTAQQRLQTILQTHPIEAALYQDARQRTLPWSAIVPTAVLVEGLSKKEAAMVRALLGEASAEELDRFEGEDVATWKRAANTAPLKGWPDPPRGDEMLEEIFSIQQLIAQEKLEEAVSRLDALAQRHREAVGIQRLLYETRKTLR